mmetsp:Transcript_14001/g.33945  ORF Transcript_14001/g.33945 Transcript_14001/m.33945 type:complete len:329 (-) Transcript_14001:1167-2153(-)
MSHFVTCPLCSQEFHRSLIQRHCSTCIGSTISRPTGGVRSAERSTGTTTATATAKGKTNKKAVAPSPCKSTADYGSLRPATRADLGRKRKRGLDRTPQEYEHLVVLDFEWTCDDKRAVRPRAEIIEFSCVLVSTRRPAAIVAEFQQYCKPEINPVLTRFCTALTGIRQEQVSNGATLAVAIERFHAWLEGHGIALDFDRDSGERDDMPFAICTWSDADLGVTLPRQMEALGLSRTPWFDRWINLKLAYASVYRRDSRGLRRCVEKIGLSFEGRAHSGLVDSINTARIVLDMINRQNHRFCRCTRYLEDGDGWSMVGASSGGNSKREKK